jgi:two-component system sensor kinase FixL
MLEEGLYVFDEKAVRHIPGEQTGGKDVKALFEDSQGRVWISGGLGISVFSAGMFRVFGPDQGLPAGAVCGFAEDRDGRIWASNLDGVFRLEKDRFVEVRDGQRRSMREITCLKGDADGTMWMGSLSAGLLRWREGSLATIGPETGFPVRSVHGILEDDHGYFWMASNSGVVRAQRKELQSVADGVASSLACQLLDLSDGLPSVECPSHRQPVCARDARGRLWFATLKGVAMIDPARFRPNTLPPPIQIEEVIYRDGAQGAGVTDRTEQRLSAPFLEGLKLPAGSRRLEIHFTALSLVAPEKVRFEIKLEGKDSRWQAVGNRRVAFFDEPQPGHHVFRVCAANNDGVWNEAGTSLAFTVQPFYWQTIWFRLGACVMLLATGGGAVLWQNRVKRRLELAEMEHLRRVSADRKRADERFRLAVEASPNGIVLVNELGRMVLVNAETERLFGYSRADLIGQTVELLVPERFRGAHPGHRAGFFAKPKTRAMGAGRDLFALRKDGSEFPVEVGLSSIQSEEGLFILTVIVDITARKQAELEIAEQREEVAHLSRVTTLGEISGSLAHELSQPLGAILNNTDSIEMHLQRPTPDLDEVRAILADIRQDDLRAGENIHGMRAFLRRRELVIQPLELGHLAGEAVRLVIADAAKRQIAIGLEIPPALPLVTGDRIHLQQVLVNLLVNGMDAVNTSAAPYRRITIRTTQVSPDAVEMTICDAGVGIPPGSLSQVFEPFHTTKPGGLGLGLAICRSIIEAHGGTIVVENNFDRGATARVTLPVCREEGVKGPH